MSVNIQLKDWWMQRDMTSELVNIPECV